MENNLKQELLKVFSDFKRGPLKKQIHGDINHGEFYLINLINNLSEKNENGNEVNVTHLQKGSKVSMPAISQILRSLEQKELISRNIAKNDRRKISVTLTEKGKKSLIEQNNNINLFLDELILSIGEEDTRELIRIFSKVIKSIEKIRSKEDI